MNCRPRDTCFVVGLHPDLGLNGHVVTLRNQPPLLIGGYTLWSFKAPIAFTTPTNVHDIFGHVKLAGSRMLIHELPDENLRPIRDPGDDAVDETLIYAGDPHVREVSHG